jgi:Uma2 family endonuclease
MNETLDTWADAERAGLRNGDFLQRAEFHRRYRELDERHGVQLIEGTVYLPSRVPMRHAEAHGKLIAWLGVYALERPALQALPQVTLLLDDVNELEPDAVLYRDAPHRVSADDFLVGAPELIVEIAYTARSIELHQKKRAYARNGVGEYVVWRVLDEAIDWFELREGEYVARTVDADGVIESVQFAGLRLDVAAALAMDVRAVLAQVR